ncbi:MAG TPA: hypothetical protein VF902_00335 [Coriobacteriia bacterium]
MPECAFHPGVETNVRCPDCDRYICPKDMVDTPVGYKCKQCGLVGRPKMGGVKPKQVLFGSLAGLGAALLLAPLAGFVPLMFLGAILYGVLVGEATRRGGGGHRTWEFAAIAAACAAAGAAAAGMFVGFNVFLLIGSPVMAALYVTSARWSG